MWKPKHRQSAERHGLRYPSDLTDAEWALVERMIPPGRHGGRPCDVNVREVLNAIFYVLSTGCQWKALPKDLPPKSTAHYYFMLWDWDGTLDHIHHALYVAVREQSGQEASPTVRSSTVKAAKPQSRSKKGSALDPQSYDAGKKVTGRKRHILVDTLGLLLSVAVHPANIQDRDGVVLVLDERTRRLFPFIERIFADGGYRGPKAAATAANRYLGDRHRQAPRQRDRLRGGAETMGRRTNDRLDQPLPSPRKRFRALRKNCRSLHPPRHDPHHAPALDQIKSLPLNPYFLDRL